MRIARELPHNFEAEQALVGVVMMNNAAYDAVCQIVKPEHFADPLHGRIYEALAALIERGQRVNAMILRSYVESDPAMAEAGGVRYLAHLAMSSVHAMDAVAPAKTVRELWHRRKLIALYEVASERAYSLKPTDDADRQSQDLEAALAEIGSDADDGGLRPFADFATEAMLQAEAAYSRAGELSGLSTGLRTVDLVLGGMQPTDLIILAGRPSMGKTALATNIAYSVATTEGAGPAAIFSLEMGGSQLVGRIVAELAGISSTRISKGHISSGEFDRVLCAANAAQGSANMFIDDTPALSISALRARARRLKRQHGLSLIVIDYLQLMTGTTSRDRVQQVAEISRGLKAIAKELDVPVLALSQLSREVEKRDDKRPQLSDLRESGSIEQDADVVMFVYREEYYLAGAEPKRRTDESDERFNARYEAWRKLMEQSSGKAEVIVAKHRHGPTGVAKLDFESSLTKFSDPAEDAYVDDQESLLP